MTTQQEIAAIRKAIKAAVPTVRVVNNRGTAWGWIGIWSGDKGGMFSDAERAGLKALGLQPGGNYCNISPDSRAFWLKKLTGHGENPPCIVCRAASVEWFSCPCDLTHWTCERHAGRVRDCSYVSRVRELERVASEPCDHDAQPTCPREDAQAALRAMRPRYRLTPRGLVLVSA